MRFVFFSGFLRVLLYFFRRVRGGGLERFYKGHRTNTNTSTLVEQMTTEELMILKELGKITL